MNWSVYSEYVGDVFGAPLAIEGLAAFMLESTFLGLWIFGWDRLSKRVHLATVWLFAIGSWASAFFIIAANSWMQRPVSSTVGGLTCAAWFQSGTEPSRVFLVSPAKGGRRIGSLSRSIACSLIPHHLLRSEA